MGAVARPLLIAKTGDTHNTNRERYGDFDWMFGRFVEGLEVRMIDAVRSPDALPPVDEIAGVVITGSPHSVTEPEPWTPALAAWTRQAVQREVPTLGVCYGHQLLAFALGGEVIANPHSYEIGTIEVELNEAGQRDPLLGSIEPGASSLRFNAVHGDIVSRLPEGAQRLASNEVCVNQAFMIGDHVRAVQFHPEFTEEVIVHYVEGRADRVRADAQRRGLDQDGRVQEVRAGLRPTPHGPRLLRRFVEHFVKGRA